MGVGTLMTNPMSNREEYEALPVPQVESESFGDLLSRAAARRMTPDSMRRRLEKQLTRLDTDLLTVSGQLDQLESMRGGIMAERRSLQEVMDSYY